ELLSPQQMVWLERLEAEHDNLRASMSGALAHGETETALRLAGALGYFCFLRTHLSEWRRWLEQALARGETATAAVRARALDALGWIIWVQGDLEQARE